MPCTAITSPFDMGSLRRLHGLVLIMTVARLATNFDMVEFGMLSYRQVINE